MEDISLFRTTKRIVMGVDALASVLDELNRMNARKVMIVTDKGLVQSGVVGKLEAVLEVASISYVVFDGVEADPNYEIVYEAEKVVKEHDADVIIGIGGGSSLDIAKVTAISATNDGDITCKSQALSKN